jgi:hypothetical protein
MSTATADSVIDKQEAEAQLSDMCGDLEEFLRRTSQAQRQMGLAYNYAESNRLAQLAGYKSAWDYFSTRVKGLTKATLEQCGLETRIWSVAVEQYGVESLRALRGYLQLHGFGQPSSPDPGVKLIKVPKPDGTHVEKTFAQCTVDEVLRATKGHPPPRPRVPLLDGVRWVYVKNSIAQHCKGLFTVRARMRYANGMALVTVQDVPLRELERLILALREGLDAQPAELRDETTASRVS